MILLHFSSQGPYFSVLLFNNRVKSFTFLSKDLDLILALCCQSLDGSLVFSVLFLQLIVFSTDSLEFILQFAQLTGRKPKVLLGTPDLLT